MDQVQSARWYPVQGGSQTLTISFRARVTENVGSFLALTAMPGCGALADLSVVYPTGRQEGVPVSSIIESAIRYAIDNGLASWYSPKNGTPEAALRAALETAVPFLGNTSCSIIVFINGQFGSVYVG